jgi:hypothetical protein
MQRTFTSSAYLLPSEQLWAGNETLATATIKLKTAAGDEATPIYVTKNYTTAKFLE